jgi:hypothetical protein
MTIQYYSCKMICVYSINFHKSEVFCFRKVKMRKMSLNIYLDVRLDHYHFNIWEYLFTIEGCKIASGNRLRIGFKKS